ncbi:HipA family kinase [Brevibacillus ginsengisoli]|uniref:HipA family kinase n=1 Tax=Brevibacillus ginsengisoli TaxID=363854 RepID=UPI003CEEE4BB
MDTSDWRVIGKRSRKLGPVWQVARYVGGVQQTGYFKFPCKSNLRRVDSMLANELIAYELAKKLGVNVAEVDLTEVMGIRGIVSLVKPATAHYSWYQFSKKHKWSPFNQLKHPEQILRTFIFDIWICNVDRHSANLIVTTDGSTNNFYAIDHGLSLLGALKWKGRQWNSNYWTHVNRYNVKYPKGLRGYIRSYHQLLPYIVEIENLPESCIESIVDQVPSNLLSLHQKTIIKNMLLSRRKSLRSIVRRWCICQRKYRGHPPREEQASNELTSNEQIKKESPAPDHTSEYDYDYYYYYE